MSFVLLRAVKLAGLGGPFTFPDGFLGGGRLHSFIKSFPSKPWLARLHFQLEAKVA